MATAVYIAAAVLPAVFLMVYIYRQDKVEKEPGGLLLKLVFAGVLSAFAAIVLEQAADYVMSMFKYSSETDYLIKSAVSVGIAEEASKLFFLYHGSWNDHNFNYLFDGVVYAVFVSLGFAALENVFYVFSYGLSVALPRALLSIPGHMCFAVFMGLFYGTAKKHDIYGKVKERKRDLFLAFLIPAFFHSFYDACAMVESDTSMTIFAIFILIMYGLAYALIRRTSKKDKEF